jgi:hypothetical protein
MFRKILKIMSILFFCLPIIFFVLIGALSMMQGIFEIYIWQVISPILFILAALALILLIFIEED